MNNEQISCAYLETLAFKDLVKLADEYGVDVPQDLDRRFLIAELLELAQEELQMMMKKMKKSIFLQIIMKHRLLQFFEIRHGFLYSGISVNLI